MFKSVVTSAGAPAAIGPYSQAVSFGDVLITSGQLGIDMATGKLAEGVENQAHASMKNLGAILKENNMTYNNIVKTTVFVTDLADFALVNSIYKEYFSASYPARSCVQVAALPMGGKVEIECVAVR